MNTLAIEFSAEELMILTVHLRRHLVEVDRELVRTDKAELQHAIARDEQVLESVLKRLEENQVALLGARRAIS